MASSSMDNDKRAFLKACPSNGSKRLEDENMGNRSSLGFHCLDYDSAHCSVKRIYWDLNVPVEHWDVNASSEHGMDNKSRHGVIMHQQKTERCFRGDPTFGTSITEKSRYSLPLRNLDLPADKERDYEDGLELQLGPPCRPDLHITWGNKSPPHLTLSLIGTNSEISCSPLKPESSNCSRGMETEPFYCNSSKAVGSGHVNSESYDGSFQVETPKEFEGCLANLKLDNHRSMSCCTESTSSKVILVVQNEDAPAGDTLPDHNTKMCLDANIASDDDGQRVDEPESPVQNVLLDDDSDMPCNSNIISGEGTCPPIDPATLPASSCNSGDNISNTISGEGTCPPNDPDTLPASSCSSGDNISNIISGEGTCPATDPDTLPASSCNSGDNISDVCTHQHTEGSLSKSSDTEELVLNSDIGKANGAEIPETDFKFATPRTDTTEPMDYDGMSQGSAEMDLSDDEYYSSHVLVARDIQVDHNENSVPSVVSLIGDTERTQGYPEGPSGVRDNISLSQSGSHNDQEDGRIVDPKPCYASENSVEHKEEGRHSNVATDSIRLDDLPMTGLNQVTKDKIVVIEEVKSGPNADNFNNNVCLYKRETSSRSTMTPVTHMQETSSRMGLTEPSQEAPKKLRKRKRPKGKPQGALPNSRQTSADILLVKNREGDASVNHPEPSERGPNVNDLTFKQTRDKVQQSNKAKMVSSPSFSASDPKDPISAVAVTGRSVQDKCDDPRRRDRSWHRHKRHTNYYSRNDHDMHDANSRRGRKLRFLRGSRYRAEFDDPRTPHAPKHPTPDVGSETADNLYPHHGHGFHQDAMFTRNALPPYSQFPSDIGQIHPVNYLGPVEHPGPANYGQSFAGWCDFEQFPTPGAPQPDVLPCAAHDNFYGPYHLPNDAEAFPGRSSFGDWRSSSRWGRRRWHEPWHEPGRKNFMRGRRF